MKILAIGAFALASLVASTAVAQTQGSQNPGPVIPGVCVYYNQRLLAQSAAGQAVQARMEQLAVEVQGELAPYATSIQTEITSLQQGGQAADPDGARRTALQARITEAQTLEQTRQDELRYTLAMQQRVITDAASPILSQIYQERGCGILLDREGVFMVNPAMEVTDEAIQRVNTALPTLSFNRMPIPAQAAQ